MNHQLFWVDENEYSSISPIGSPCSRVERSFGNTFLEIPPDGWNAFETQPTPKSNSNRTPENTLEHGKKTRIKIPEVIGLTEDDTSSVWSSATPSSFPIRLPLRPVHFEEEHLFEGSLTCSSASNLVERSFGSRSFEILHDGDAFETQSTQETTSNRTPEYKLEHGNTTRIEVGVGEDISLTESETGPSESSSPEPELPIRIKLSLGAQVVNKITEMIGDLSLNYEEKIQSMSKYIESGKRRESELIVTISSIQQKYDKVLSDFQKLTEEHSKLQQRNAKMETIEPGSNHVLVNCECSGKLLSPLNEVNIFNTKLEGTVSGCQFEQKVKNIVSAGALEEDHRLGKGSQSGSDNAFFFMDEYTSLVSSCCGSHMGFQNREDPRMIVCNSACLSVMNNDNKLKRAHTEPLVAQTVPIISPERPWKENPGTVPSSDNMFADSGEYKSAGSNGGKRNTLTFSPMPVSDFSSGMFTDSLGYKAADADSTGGERNKDSISSMPVSDFSTWMFTDSVEYKSADNNGGKQHQVTVSPIPVSDFNSGMFTDFNDSGEYKLADNNGGNHNQVSFSSCGGGSVRIGNTVELVSDPQKSSLGACQNKGRSINEINAKPKTVLDIDFNRAIFKRDPNPSPAKAEGGNHVTVVGCGNDSGQKGSASHTMSSPRTKVTSRRTQPWTTCWRWNYRRSHTHEGRIARPKSTVLEN